MWRPLSAFWKPFLWADFSRFYLFILMHGRKSRIAIPFSLCVHSLYLVSTMTRFSDFFTPIWKLKMDQCLMVLNRKLWENQKAWRKTGEHVESNQHVAIQNGVTVILTHVSLYFASKIYIFLFDFSSTLISLFDFLPPMIQKCMQFNNEFLY